MAHKMSILGDSFDDPPVETSIRLMLQTTHSRAQAEHKREFRYLIGVLALCSFTELFGQASVL